MWSVTWIVHGFIFFMSPKTLSVMRNVTLIVGPLTQTDLDCVARQKLNIIMKT